MHYEMLVRFVRKRKIGIKFLFLFVVIGIVISFVGDALKSLLQTRQEQILSNLNEANERAKKAENKLVEAKSKYEAAKLKAQKVRDQGFSNLDKDKKNYQIQANEMVQKLNLLKKETLLSQQQKTLKLISKKVIQSALGQVKEKLERGISLKTQTSINNFYIALLRNYGG